MNAMIGDGAIKDFTDGLSASLYLYELCTNFDKQEKGEEGTMPMATVSADLYFATRIVQDVPLHPSMVSTEKEIFLANALMPLIQQVIAHNRSHLPPDFIQKKVDEMIRIGEFNNVKFKDYDEKSKDQLRDRLERLARESIDILLTLRF